MSKDELWIKYKESKDIVYKQLIIEEYVFLVKIVAGRMYNYYGGNIEYDDLIGYGVFGLIDAVEKFDITRDIKFETYAQIRIRGAIIDNLRKIDWVPRSLRKKSKDIENTISQIENRLGRTATYSEIAEEKGITVKELEDILAETSTFNVISFEELLSIKGEGKIGGISESPDEVFEEDEVKSQLIQIIDRLPDKDRIVISLYYYNGLTYKEVGETLELSESRISQIHSRAIIAIKNEMIKLGYINSKR